jgi:hypothetical protein
MSGRLIQPPKHDGRIGSQGLLSSPDHPREKGNAYLMVSSVITFGFAAATHSITLSRWQKVSPIPAPREPRTGQGNRVRPWRIGLLEVHYLAPSIF